MSWYRDHLSPTATSLIWGLLYSCLLGLTLSGCVPNSSGSLNEDLQQVIDPAGYLPERFAKYGSDLQFPAVLNLPDPPMKKDLIESAFVDLGPGQTWLFLFRNETDLTDYFTRLVNQPYESSNEGNLGAATVTRNQLEDLGEKAFTVLWTWPFEDILLPPSLEQGATFRRVYFSRCNALVIIWLFDPQPSLSPIPAALKYAWQIDRQIETMLCPTVQQVMSNPEAR